MMIVHFRDTFPFRVLEWTMAVIMILWGFILFNPGFDASKSIWGTALFGSVSQYTFGTACLIVGGLRFLALTINGMWWRTPFIRLCMTFFANYLWVQICFGLVQSDTLNTGWAVYPVFVAIEVYNAFRAADDSKKSWTVKSEASDGRHRQASRLGADRDLSRYLDRDDNRDNGGLVQR